MIFREINVPIENIIRAFLRSTNKGELYRASGEEYNEICG